MSKKYKPGTHAFAVIADEVFQEVCAEYADGIYLSGEDLYRQHVGRVNPKWPESATAPEIREAARAAMEGRMAEAKIKKPEPVEDNEARS